MKKKVFSIFLLIIVAAFLVSCGPEKPKEEKIVLITDKGDITDKSFNEGAYNGVKAFGDAEGVKYGYLKPAKATDEDYIDAIEKAIADGATVIVTPGYLFEGPINVVQHEFPEVKFIILDGSPSNAVDADWNPIGSIEKNVYSIFYAEEQSGFLAGYAAVMDGYRKLGFMGGMAVPAVQRFGHGYVQGAAKAAKELGLAANAVTVDYLYTGDFAATPEVQAAAAAMFESGVEVIFACGGAVGQSVMAAAAASTNNGKVIGVDVDQSYDSPTVITSATKSLASSVIYALEAIFKTKEWEAKFGGVVDILAADRDGVGLPIENSRFNNFTTADYNTLYGKLVNKTITVSDVIGEFGDDGNAAKQFETAEVKVNVIPFES